jgi:predicted ATPase
VSVGNLPAEPTSFVGRRREIDVVKRLVGEHRLVTLTGGAGVGKTRLARQVAAQLRPAFADGVRLVQLGALEDETFVGQTLADAVGVREESRLAWCEALAEFLRDKELLLVLDNCEHVLNACTALVTDLLQCGPRLRVLATSRQVLHTSEEWPFEVPPLPVSEADTTLRAEFAEPSEAVWLFTERAATALPGFRTHAGNHAVVARLCRRLGGMPLAIELAAVHVRAMSLEDILARLEDRYLEMLGAGAQLSVPRLQSLQAAIDWNFDLCSEQEQRVWARASVFRDGFDLPAAERVCSGMGIDRADMLGLIAGLADKSVLSRSMAGETGRYQMLEPVREYGLRRLADSGRATVVRMHHRQYFGELVAQAEQAILGPGELAAYAGLARDHANLRAALEFCLLQPGQARAGLEIAARLMHYWTDSGHHREGRFWLDRALAANPEPSRIRAKALWVTASLALLQGDQHAALSLIGQCRLLALRLEDESALAHAANVSGAAFLFSDVQRAVALLEQSLNRLQALGDRAGVWLALERMMLAQAVLGDTDRACAFGERAVDLASASGACLTRTWSLGLYGLVQWLAGNQRRATELVRESLAASSAVVGHWEVAHSLEVLAWDAAARRDPERAARLLGSAHVLWHCMSTPLSRLPILATEHARCEQRTRAALGEERFHKLFDDGTTPSLEQAIDYALAVPPTAGY